MRRHASPHGRGWETDHGAGMVPDEAEERTRLACHRSRTRRVYGVACGRRSRHEPLRAPGRTRSGDLPLTRRTLCRLSYRGECRKPPAVRRRPPTRPSRAMGPDREEGHAIVRVRGARRFRGTGLRGPAVRIPPGRVRRFARHGGVEPPSTVLETVGPPLSRWRVHCFRSSVFNHAIPCRVRGGMAWYASPNGRPTECVPPAEWFRAASLRRPTRLIRAALLD